MLSKTIEPSKVSPILSGFMYAIIWMALCSLLLSLVLWLSGLSEQSLPTIIYFVHAVSLFVGGLVTGKRSDRNGWYHGSLVGLLYCLLLLIIGFLGFDSSPQLPSLIVLGLALASGALGGMLGVNMKKR